MVQGVASVAAYSARIRAASVAALLRRGTGSSLLSTPYMANNATPPAIAAPAMGNTCRAAFSEPGCDATCWKLDAML